MKGNWSIVLCGRLVTVATLLMYQFAAVAEGPETEPEPSEISIRGRLRFSDHLAREGWGCTPYIVTLSVPWPATFDLCFQGHDPRLISFQAPILTAGLSLSDTPG